MAHRTTWICPERVKDHKGKDGHIRRNPYRNQIDYIITRTLYNALVTDSRSYAGFEISTDHRLVKTSFRLEWYKMKPKKDIQERLNITQLQNHAVRLAYQASVIKKMKTTAQQIEDTNTPQKVWHNIVEACQTSGKEQLGIKKRTKKSNNKQVQELSTERKSMRLEVSKCKSKTKRRELQIDRNSILNQIHKLLHEKQTEMEHQIEEIEKSRNDSTRMYKAIRSIRITDPQKQLLIDVKDGKTTDETEQVKIITDHFINTIYDEATTPMKHVPPKEMVRPFTQEEIKNAIRSLRNNKSAGTDNICAELLKYSQEVIYSRIAEIFNSIARSGEYPEELKEGILVPLSKPGKPQGPPANLRPIILLSVIRKILAICMIRRTSQKLSNKIPITQAAYRAGRSTTENVLTFKVLAEKAITSKYYESHLLMLDMSKAFDTVQRKSLFDELQEILPEDELHMLYILINYVNLKVGCGKTTGEKINTNIGVPQGDCLSPVLFTLYLAAALETKRNREDHNYSKPSSCSTVANHRYSHVEEHSYNRTKDTILIDQQHADDIGWAANNVQNISSLEANITARMQKYNLHINKEKTEQYCIKRNGEEHWRKCKYPCSLLSTTEDITKRKQLANAAYSKLKYILEDRRTTPKIRTLDAYVGSIFLYNKRAVDCDTRQGRLD